GPELRPELRVAPDPKSRQLRKWGSCVRISFSNQKPRMKFTPAFWFVLQSEAENEIYAGSFWISVFVARSW
mgnify:CR=1